MKRRRMDAAGRDPRTNAFDDAEKHAELQRVLHHPLVTRMHKRATILRVLGEMALRDPNHRYTEAALDVELKARTKFTTSVRVAVWWLRELLNHVYMTEPRAEGDVCLVIPRTRAMGGYCCTFESYPAHYKPHGELVTLFWSQLQKDLQGSRKVDGIHMVFCNELPEFRSHEDWGVSSGTGEVVAIWEISQMCRQTNTKAAISRSRHVTAADLEGNHALVFLGSSLAMGILRTLPTEMPLKQAPRFAFRWNSEGGWQGDGEIARVDGASGAGPFRYRTPAGEEKERDYAYVAVLTGVDGRPLVFAAGLSSLGTEAAATFLCRDVSLWQIYDIVSSGGERRLKPFEVVLGVTISHEVPEISEIVDHHVHD